jgi:hypothetical protein
MAEKEVTEETARSRNVNFTPQDSLLLAHLMGERHWDIPSITVHQFVKHRFTTGRPMLFYCNRYSVNEIASKPVKFCYKATITMRCKK